MARIISLARTDSDGKSDAPTRRRSWSTWSRHLKSDAHDLRFPKTARKVFVKSGIEFAHRFWLVPHPIIIYVFPTPACPEGLSIPAEAVPAHPRFVHTQLKQLRREPTLFDIVVQVWCAVAGSKQQAAFSGNVRLQVLCNFRVQVNLTISSIRFQFRSKYWLAPFDLLLEHNCSATAW